MSHLLQYHWKCEYCDNINNKSDGYNCNKCFTNKNVQSQFHNNVKIKENDNNGAASNKTSKKNNNKLLKYINKFNLNTIEKAGRFSSMKDLTINKNGEILTDNNHFIDKDFLPNRSSLFQANKKFSFFRTLIHSRGLNKTKDWVRPHAISIQSAEKDMPITLFSNPHPNDVLQGGIGSCWFIAALSALAERSYLVYDLITPKYYNTYGLHKVKFCRRGQWVVIDIDDYLPVNRSNNLVFGYSRNRQLWVSFVEKALAKLYGSYEAIASGACVEGMQTLTGKPCQVVYLLNPRINFNNQKYDLTNRTDKDNPNLVWENLLYSRRAGYLMSTLCLNKDLNIIDFLKVGLVFRHIYTVLDVKEFIYNEIKIKLLRLRNPWGKKGWNGPLISEQIEKSKYFPKMPERINMKIARTYTNNDGCFWITFQDLLKYFYDITICKANDVHLIESRQSSYFYDQSKYAHIYTFSINESLDKWHSFDLELFSTGKKSALFDRNDDPDIDLCLILCKVDNFLTYSNMTCIAFEHNVEYFVSLTAQLGNGNYIAYATSFKALKNISHEVGKNNNIDYYTYNLVAHCSANFVFSSTMAPNHLIADFFYAAAVKANRIKHDLDSMMRTLVLSGSSNHGVIVENLSYDSTILIDLDSSSAKNVDQTRTSTKIIDRIPPRSRQLVTYLMPINFNKAYLIGYKINSSVIKESSFNGENNPSILPVYNGIHSLRKIL